MDFKEEIEKHLLWKSTIESLFDTRSHQFTSVNVVSDDHLCQLGRWIHSNDAKAYASNAVFQELETCHKEFHQQASDILALYKEKEPEQAQEKLQRFTELSNEVIACLEKLQAFET